MPAPVKTAVKKTVRMDTFEYECQTPQKHNIKGELQASNINLARADLRRQGLTPIRVKKKSISIFEKYNKKKITPGDICQFSRQVATMLASGIPLVQALDIVAKGFENESVRDLIYKIKSSVEAGQPFSETLQDYPRQFDGLYCNLVAAGEASGALDTMLDRIATYKEKSESLKRKIKKALFYPAAVMVVAMVVTGILLIFVVPQFEALFKGFGADLPMFTQMVLNLSAFVQKWWWIILALIIGGIAVFTRVYRNSKKVQAAVDRLVLKLPIFGPILNKACVARFSRTLSTTFSAGVPLIEALDSVSNATGNIVYVNAVQQIKDEISQGSQMNVAMRNTGVFSNMVVQMVGIGEEAGALDDMLSKVANIYEEEVDLAVDSLSSLLEPLIMAILGVVVGGLVIAMYLPIFKMGSVV